MGVKILLYKTGSFTTRQPVQHRFFEDAGEQFLIKKAVPFPGATPSSLLG